MSDSVCRAITFINFHIPLRWNSGIKAEYSTVGFFDGLFTERIHLDYKKDDLRELWGYTSRRTVESKGYYSYQNVFGFSRDEWNGDTKDEEFWKPDTNREFPLTFVVFLQIKDYMIGEFSLEKQCKAFNEAVRDELKQEGKVYTYSTIDKNDFVVCIKSKAYEHTVKAIKKLHNTGVKVVYSYTIFSVHYEEVIKKMDEQRYPYLFEEKIPSICLKGITNSFESGHRVALDRKYRQFANMLINKLYEKRDSAEEVSEDSQKVLYDILGDNDFRLIARDVSLGRILREYAPGGILCYTEGKLPYYLFSSSLVLNTKTGDKEGIEEKEIDSAIEEMQKAFVCRLCDDLSNRMEKIKAVVEGNPSQREDCVVTFCQAIFQLLQSLKVLEEAPTKKYDFYSLFMPLEALVEILEGKMGDPAIANNEMIYEFIHKISMTLHGTLRTDIQFFQIKDFNVIVHYAPAKIRAFYALWAMRIRDLYIKFVSDEKKPVHKYSFILAPGMYKGTAVKQLYESSEETNRLMLIMMPERHIYSPRWITILLAHEVSHFVGSDLRHREQRHKTWLELIARILELELQAFFYRRLVCVTSTGVIEAYRREPDLLGQIGIQLSEMEERIREDKWKNRKNKFHSEISMELIMEAFRAFEAYDLEKILWDFSLYVRDFVLESPEKYAVQGTADECRIIFNEIVGEMKDFCNAFGSLVMKEVLDMLKAVMSETFADIMAILTLEISPLDYIELYVKTELGEGEGKVRVDNTLTFIGLRIALVAKTMNKVFQDDPSIKSYIKNFDEWTGDLDGRLKSAEDSGGKEGEIAAAVNRLLQNVCCMSAGADQYKGLYDAERGCFRGGRADFLKDEKVFGLICDYLVQCAEFYIQKVKASERVAFEREEILKTYKNISENTEIGLMEEIESFLSKTEKKYEKRYEELLEK